MINVPDPIMGMRFAALAGQAYNDSEFSLDQETIYAQTHFLDPERAMGSAAQTIITHNSDQPLNVDRLMSVPSVDWWSCNCEVWTNPRAGALPLGLLNSTGLVDAMNKIPLSLKPETLAARLQQPRLAYLNCHPGSDVYPQKFNERTDVNNRFNHRPWVTVEKYKSDRPLPFSVFFNKLALHAYCFSPRGAGVDCHRTWEAITMGCIPIVKRDPVMLPFAAFPILFVDDWAEVTVDMLRARHPEIAAKFQTTRHMMEFKYWEEKICNA